MINDPQMETHPSSGEGERVDNFTFLSCLFNNYVALARSNAFWGSSFIHKIAVIWQLWPSSATYQLILARLLLFLGNRGKARDVDPERTSQGKGAAAARTFINPISFTAPSLSLSLLLSRSFSFSLSLSLSLSRSLSLSGQHAAAAASIKLAPLLCGQTPLRYVLRVDGINIHFFPTMITHSLLIYVCEFGVLRYSIPK
jgi:hypothetical protein